MITTSHKATFVLLSTLFLFVVGSCSSDSSPTGGGGGGGGGGGTIPQVATVNPPTAMTNAANANPTGGAAQGVGYFDQYNSLADFSSWLVPPSPIRSNVTASPAVDTNTTTYTVGGVTVTVIIVREDGNPYSFLDWTVTLNGTDSLGTYSDFMYIAGNHYQDQNGGGGVLAGGRDQQRGDAASSWSGNMNVWDRATQTGIQESWSWGSVDSVANYVYLGSSPQDIQIHFGVDGSGSLDFRENSVLRYQAVWLDDGSGTWTEWDAQGTTVVDSGSF